MLSNEKRRFELATKSSHLSETKPTWKHSPKIFLNQKEIGNESPYHQMALDLFAHIERYAPWNLRDGVRVETMLGKRKIIPVGSGPGAKSLSNKQITLCLKKAKKNTPCDLTPLGKVYF